MAELRPHDLDCAREVMSAVAHSTATAEGLLTVDSWEAFLTMRHRTLIPRYHDCHNVAAMMAIWALARMVYRTPREFESEIGVILTPFYLGESL